MLRPVGVLLVGIRHGHFSTTTIPRVFLVVRPDPTIRASCRSPCTVKLESTGHRRFRSPRLLAASRVSSVISLFHQELQRWRKYRRESRPTFSNLRNSKLFHRRIDRPKLRWPWQNFMLRLKLSDIVRLFSYKRRSLYGQFGLCRLSDKYRRSIDFFHRSVYSFFRVGTSTLAVTDVFQDAFPVYAYS